jgi:putative DNA primase/helicase
MAINRPNDRFSNRAFRLQAATPPAIEHLSFPSTDSCTESTAEPSSLEQTMIPQQTMMKAALPPYTPSPLPADADATVTGTDIVYLAHLQPQPVDWLWQHRLAAGTLAMLSGEPGSGKTWVALAIAAALTRGRDPFTGEKLKPATVLYASAEHPAAQVIQPRFAGLHGDPARLLILRADSASSTSSPDSALRDLPNALDDALQKTQAHLVILDPWEIDLDRASQTRPLLDRLARLAELHRCCILLIRHLAKPTAGRPVRRGRASMDCSAALRTEFLVGSSPDAPAQTALLHVKSNLGPLAPPLDYRIGEAGNFHWTGLSNLTPEDLLAPRPTGAGLPKRKFAAQWLRDCLQPGSQTQGSIEIAAERDGVCITTLRRAKFDIGVRSSKDGKSGAWWWTLPPPEDECPPVSEARCSN